MLIKDVGFPIVMTLILLTLLACLIKKGREHQIQSDKHYNELVKKFINRTKEITDQQKEYYQKMVLFMKDMTKDRDL